MNLQHTLLSSLRHSFKTHASKPALIGAQTSWTYAELGSAIGVLGEKLVAAGVRPGEVVALLLNRSTQLVLAELTTIQLGATYAPLDTQSPRAQLTAALEILQPRVVLVDGSVGADVLARYCTIDVRRVSPNGASDPGNAGTVSPEGQRATAGNTPAYITFTSGTTGTPKGVMIPHSGITRLVTSPNWATFNCTTRFGFLSSPAFDASTLEVWAPLLNGGCCVVQESPSPSLDEIADFILDQRLTHIFLTAGLFSALTDHRPDAFQGLQELITGGERVSPRHARTVLSAYPALHLVNGYGPTENTTFTTCRTITPADTENPAGIPIGSPIRGTQIRIGTDTNDADAGELLATGDGMSLGYLNDDALNAAKFTTIDGTRWYRTGDLVRRRDDGALEYEGRVDRQVKLQGHRIELDAVETVLSAVPGVGQCAVFVAGDSIINRHLVACYTMSQDVQSTTSDILASLRAQLPPHAVPRVLRELAEMPLNANGKIDYRTLQVAPSAARNGEAQRNLPNESSCANTTAVQAELAAETPAPIRFESNTEQRLAELWAEQFPDAQLSRSLNFENIGATSLQALQLSASIRRSFRKDFSALQVLRHPVLYEQAAIIDRLPLNAPTHAPANDRTKRHELTHIQRTVLAADALDESRCAFLVHVALRFRTHMDTARLRIAFEQLAERHPVLRLSIADEPSAHHASVDKNLRTGWWRHHGALPASPTPDELAPEILTLINRPLAYANDGVMRVDFWGLKNEPTLVVWTIHHVAVDEASIDRCLDDLDALLSDREPAPVVGNPLDVAEFERVHTSWWAQKYWPTRIVEQLGAVAPALPRAPGRGFEVNINIPIALARNFLPQCRASSMTPFVPLLVAYGRAVQSVFGKEHAFVATPFTRRSDPDIGDSVGCFIDLNLVEAGALKNESLPEHLGRVYATVSQLQECAFFPFEAVAAEVARRKPGAERHLNTFAFTWRQTPSRDLKLGGRPARLLRVPQQGARFGMTLHGWLENGELRCSIEALSDTVSTKFAEQVAQQLVLELPSVCATTFVPYQKHTTPEVTSIAMSPKLVDALQRRWMQNTGVSANAVTDTANFWEHGGNSLTALQMLAQVVHDSNARIAPAEFFALPTFGNLCRLAATQSAYSDAIHAVVGNPEAKRLVVAFPGDNGSAVGMHPFGKQLLQQLGDDRAVVLVDLLEILRNAPEGNYTDYINGRCLQLLDELGRDRIAALVGFSSGGLTALSLADALRGSAKPAVWLLDTYKPETATSLLINRTLRPLIRRLLRSKLIARAAGTHVRVRTAKKPPEEFPKGSIELLRQQARIELLAKQPAPPTGNAHLVQATKTARREFLLWNRGTNGFSRAYFANGSVLAIDCNHEDIPSQRGEEVAAHIAGAVGARTHLGSAD